MKPRHIKAFSELAARQQQNPEYFRLLRESSRLSIGEVARLISASTATVSRWERGISEPVDSAAFEAWVDLLQRWAETPVDMRIAAPKWAAEVAKVVAESHQKEAAEVLGLRGSSRVIHGGAYTCSSCKRSAANPGHLVKQNDALGQVQIICSDGTSSMIDRANSQIEPKRLL